MDSIISLRLRVDGTDYIVNTFENTTLQITRSVQSLDYITSDQKTVTEQTFRVPLNGELVEALGDLADPSQDANVDLRKAISGSVLVDGYPLYEGTFQVVSVVFAPNNNAREVELLFKGNESSLKAELDVIPLRDAFDGETIPYDVDEIASYYNAPSTYITSNGYTWDLIDWGQNLVVGTAGAGEVSINDSSNPLSQLNFKPSVTVQKMLDQIETTTGYFISVDSSFSEIENHIMPLHNNKSNIPILDTSPNDYTGYMNRTNTLAYTANNDTTTSPQLMNFNQAVNYNQTVFNVGAGFDRYTCPTGVNGTFNFRLDYEFDITESGLASSASGEVRLYLYKNGVAVGGAITNNYALLAGGSANVEGSYSFSLNLNATDYIDFRLVFYQLSIPTDPSYTITYTQTAASQLVCTSSPAYTSSSNVRVPENIDEDLTCWDIVSDIIKRCNGILVKTDSSTYSIVPWATWIDDNADIINLNGRLLKDGAIQIEPTGATGAKSIRFTYPESDLFYNQKFRELQAQEYGELLIADTGSDFTTKEYVLESRFVNPVPVPMEDSPITIIRVIDEDGVLIETKPMLIPRSNYSRYQRIEMQDVYGGTAYSYDFIPATNHWYDSQNGGFTEKDMNFGTSLTFFAGSGYPNNTLYERFWRRYIRETYGEDSRKLKMQVSISPTEFQTWLLNENLLYKGSYFRLNAINNFNLNKREPCSVEIVKRLTLLNSDIAPYYPYNVLLGVVQWKDSSDNSDVGDGSTEPIADIETSCRAYGFFYDDTNASGGTGAIGIQVGQILPIN